MANFPDLPMALSGSSSGLKVVLNPEQAEQEVLDILRTPRYGYQDYTVVEIDATAFEDGGTLTINIRMGTAKPGGSFDLYDSEPNFRQRAFRMTHSPQLGIFHPDGSEESDIALMKARSLNSVLLVHGSMRKGASTPSRKNLCRGIFK